MLFNRFKTLFILVILACISCNTNEPKPNQIPNNESELITTMKVVLKDSSNNNNYLFVFKDSDGEGGNSPTQFDSIRLQKNSVYYCSILLLDESKSVTDTISNAVLQEAADHLFVYSSNALELIIQLIDTDKNGLPLGLRSIWRTGNVGTGNLRIRLKHQPGIKNGNPEPGETDTDIEFYTEIQ